MTGHTAGTDEVVILFRISPGGWVPLHSGQPQRVNVHFCLLNCEGANITVNGTTLDYHDGTTFAFEDRMWHELHAFLALQSFAIFRIPPHISFSRGRFGSQACSSMPMS